MEDKTNVIKIQRYHSPCGDLMLGSFEDKLCLCDWAAESHRDIVDRRLRKVLKAGYEKSTSDVILEAMSQLDEYFNGERTVFEVPLLFVGTEFQKSVWYKLLEIPYGSTVSYGELAKQLDLPKAVRAVAAANGANAISIFAPCHRVIGSNHSLVGYGGGLPATSIEYAKRILNETHASLFDAAQETGLSGTGRLYDLFVNIEGMTPGEYKNGGESLSINYSFAKSPFGEIFIASTDKGICCMEFADEHDAAFNSLRKKFPNAKFTSIVDEVQQNALFIFTQDWSKLKEIKLHLKGTDFQLKVWETLLKIPVGGLTTYGDIAVGINNPRACRAVGTAVGENPVAFLIPCHRVIRASGELGNYHWGEIRKTAMIGWEAAKGEVKRGL